jgi:hypothetical protein
MFQIVLHVRMMVAFFMSLLLWVGNMWLSCRQWVTSVMSSLFLGRYYEVNIVSGLAFFVIFTGTHLGAFLRLAVSILQAPVPNFEMTPCCVLLLIFGSMELFMLVVHSVSQMVGDAVTDMSMRVSDLAGAILTAVMVGEARCMLENIICILIIIIAVR